MSEFEEKQGDKHNPREGSMAQGTFKSLDWEYIKEVLKCPDTDLGIYPISSKKL